MAGWGDIMDRVNLWKQMATSKTMIVAIIDHKRTSAQIKNMENEIELGWTGTTRGIHKIIWAHAPAKNKNIGGITIAVHPILARYSSQTELADDKRGWGRWTGVMIKGRQQSTIVIATYGPTENENIEATESMWQRQLKAMQKIDPQVREKNPQYQYIKDLHAMITELGKKYKIVIVGDSNINIQKDSLETKLWNGIMDDEGLRNSMNSWWPNRKHQCYTWINGEKKSWIDHIYVSNKFLQDGTITGAGIDTGKITYKSDHRMVGVRVNFTTMVGRIEGMPKTQKTRPRTVKATIKKNKEAYRTIAQNREDKRDEKKGKKKGFKYWETELNKIKNKITRASTKKNKQKAKKK